MNQHSFQFLMSEWEQRMRKKGASRVSNNDTLVRHPYAIIANPDGNAWNFASRVYDQVKKRGLEGKIELIEGEITTFRDGEFKPRIASNIREKICFLIHDSSLKPADWAVQLGFFNNAMKYAAAAKIVDVLPYLRFSRQDRKDESRVSISAKDIADRISLYANRVISVDLHAEQIQGFYSIPLDNLYSFPYAIRHIFSRYPELRSKDISVLSPDVGGAKRAEAFMKRMSRENDIDADLILGYKKRSHAGEIDRLILLGDVTGKTVFIVDDITDSGKTSIMASIAAKERGAREVYLYATHALCTEGYNVFEGHFEKVFMSNTIPKKIDHPLFEEIDLVPLIAEAVHHTATGESLSELFK